VRPKTSSVDVFLVCGVSSLPDKVHIVCHDVVNIIFFVYRGSIYHRCLWNWFFIFCDGWYRRIWTCDRWIWAVPASVADFIWLPEIQKFGALPAFGKPSAQQYTPVTLCLRQLVCTFIDTALVLVKGLFPTYVILSIQKVLSGSGRAGRLPLMGKYICHRLLARPKLDNTFWTDSTIVKSFV